MKNFTLVLILAAALITSFSLPAHNSVVVVPLGGDDAQSMANVVRVAKSGGDFTSVVAALNSVQNATETNPFLIFIGPGDYNLGTQSLSIPSFVNIVGSGPEITRLKGTVGSATDPVQEGLLIVAGTNRLSGFSLENADSLVSSAGIVNDGGNLVLDDMTVLVSNGIGTFATAVRNFSDGLLSISDSTLRVEGGSADTSTGVRNIQSVLELENSRVLVVGSAGTQFGINAVTARTNLVSIDMQVIGGERQIGVINSGGFLNAEGTRMNIENGDGDQTGTLTFDGVTNLVNVGINLIGGENQTGVQSDGLARSDLNTVGIQLIDATGTENIAVANSSSSTSRISQSRIFITGDIGAQRGVSNITDSSSTINNSFIFLEGDAPTQQGVVAASADSYFRMSGSEVTASTNSVAIPIGAVNSYVSDTRLSGTALGALKCDFVFTDADVELDESCQVPPSAAGQ